ncbi:hypothetical protein F5878DRAFT_710702 [Lentinula raphanica]|uniref:Uncharacterized protein n=1 Tax=Lentinula raphanica TaxID=153919 RepID=A0AA38P796_9AGAR|nr:hypothetical protein F5878DRAFT_710702 [Lentinula raphanica]
MHLQPLLPNELLRCVIEYIAYTPKLSTEVGLDGTGPEFQFKCLSNELLALSVSNWRLRRACLPFIFAKIKINHDEDAKKLENHLAVCAQFTKTLVLGSSGEITEAGERIISLILPQLEQLPNVELGGCSKRTELLKTILAHPTVTSVLVDGLPNESMCSHDLSKVTLNRTSSLSTSLEKYFDRGMRLKCLSLCLDFDSLDNEVGTLDFTGLETIEVHIHSESVSFSWLARFLSTHPTLNELWLLEIERNLFAHDAPPFFSLVEEYQPQGLHDLFIISKVGLRRAKPVDESSQEWHVIELTFRANDLLIKKLSLLAASFPQLEILKLELDFGVEKYDIADLCSAFALFSSLRVVYFEDILDRLSFVYEKIHFQELQVRAEKELMAFASCLAKQVRTLDSVYIEDAGYDLEDDGKCIQLWCFNGWLHVLNSERVVGGTLV